MNKGFTLFEMIVVLFVVGILSSLLLFNFRDLNNSPMARHQLSSLVISDLRRAQSMALAGVEYNDMPVCGFGLHYEAASGLYFIYIRPPDSISEICDIAANRNYNNLTDSIIETRTISNPSLTINWTDDIFFESPNPKTYIANSNNPAISAILDVVVLNGSGVCPSSDCTRITVSTSGRIDVNN